MSWRVPSLCLEAGSSVAPSSLAVTLGTGRPEPVEGKLGERKELGTATGACTRYFHFQHSDLL